MYSDTTHGRFIERMDLARAVLRLRHQKTTERAISRLMDHHDTETLRRIVANGGRAREDSDEGICVETVQPLNIDAMVNGPLE